MKKKTDIDGAFLKMIGIISLSALIVLSCVAIVYGDAVTDPSTSLLITEEQSKCVEMFRTALNISNEQDCKLEWVNVGTSNAMYCKHEEGWFALDIACNGTVNKIGFMTMDDLKKEGYLQQAFDYSKIWMVGIAVIIALFAMFAFTFGKSSSKDEHLDSSVDESSEDESEEDEPEPEPIRVKKGGLVLPKQETIMKKQLVEEVMSGKLSDSSRDYINKQEEKVKEKNKSDGGVKGW